MKPYSSFTAIRQDLAEGAITCQLLVEYHLKKIEQHNPKLNLFVETYAEEALERARLIDQKLKSNKAGRLAGLVVGLKDVICYKDHRLQAASKILDGFVSQFSATVVERLLAEDAIIIGRQNCDEFAMGSSNENSVYGPSRNAADPLRVPGGSSGASAAAVQADMCCLSLGSDTGGSVRQPAAFCGVIGLKPTYSRLSRWGLIAYASSFDCIGLIGKHPEDIALVLEVIAGADGLDSTASQRPVPAYSEQLRDHRQGYRIACLREGIENEAIAPDIRRATMQSIEKLQAIGHQVDIVDFPLLSYVLPTYYILTTAEASSNLARYDGVRYGYRSPQAHDLESLYKKTRAEAFGKEVKRRIMLGTFVLSADYYDAYYTKAQRVRRLIKEKTQQLLEQYDFLLTPTTPDTAFPLGSFENDPVKMYLADIFTVQANVAGLPAISIPAGKDQRGLPIGIQFTARPFAEGELLQIAYQMLHA